MPRTNTLAVNTKTETSEIEHQPPTSFIARPKGENTATVSVPQAQALLIQELETHFDPDLQVAMIKRLVQAQKEINALATDEQKIAKVIELGRLATVEKAREDGVQLARAEFAKKVAKHKKKQQQEFIRTQLPELIKACSSMPTEDMKSTVEVFSKRLDIDITWEETDEGLRCNPTFS